MLKVWLFDFSIIPVGLCRNSDGLLRIVHFLCLYFGYSGKSRPGSIREQLFMMRSTLPTVHKSTVLRWESVTTDARSGSDRFI